MWSIIWWLFLTVFIHMCFVPLFWRQKKLLDSEKKETVESSEQWSQEHARFLEQISEPDAKLLKKYFKDLLQCGLSPDMFTEFKDHPMYCDSVLRDAGVAAIGDRMRLARLLTCIPSPETM